MTELWLKFRDENGDDRRVLVERSKFIIGRHSENDLSIPNGKLSREHVKIEAFGDVFVVSDCGSSNGTTLNGTQLSEPVALQDGDVLNLGGGLEIAAELISDKPKARKQGAADEDSNAHYSSGNSSASGGTNSQGASASVSGGSSIPTGVFIAAPVMVILLLVCGGGLLILFGSDNGNNNGRNNDIVTYSPTPDDTPEISPTPSASSTAGNGTTVSPSPESTNTQPTPEITDEKKKIEANSAAFLRRIALNDPNAFLKTTEIDIVNSKLSQFKGSGALAENLKAVKNNASQFQSLAQSKGLKPQFLAVAALAEIGNSRGNPLEVANRMPAVFASELRISLANNLADDNLLMIAAYDQGKAGKFKDLRNTMEALAKKNPSVSPREIRTIWFLKRQGKISDAEYEFALRFLAIGTITQNPKDFGVNAEAVIFN